MSEPELEGNVGELKINAIIGFDGTTINGLLVHPDGKHVVYPIGNKVAIVHWTTKKQHFLVGHTNIISSIAVSRSGKYVASGQINHIGFKARVIIWDFEKLRLLFQYEHHKVRVEAVIFSHDDHYVITLGGRDCGSVVVWDMNKAQVLCGAQVSRGIQGEATVMRAMNRRGVCFMTAGDCHLCLWKINKDARNVKSVDVAMLKLRRTILCLDTNERDEFTYCGTTTGDVLKIRLNYHHDAEVLDTIKPPTTVGCFARLSHKKLPRGSVDLYHAGVRSIKLLFNGWLIIGAGDGQVEMVEETEIRKMNTGVKMPSLPALRVLKSAFVNGGVTSLQLQGEHTILAATVNSEIYRIHMEGFLAELIITCHTSPIYTLAFPYKFSEVFATGGQHDVRIWKVSTMEELLRIRVPNFKCSSIVFAYDGKSILTGWSDGVIRSFTPLTGRLAFAILNAHNKGVSALAITSHGRNIVSGGCEGQVRLWEISPYRQQLMCTLKEHKGPVSAIDINIFDNEAASASTDGTCIIWDLVKQCRRQILFAKTLFMCVKYYPTGVQILTGGSDRKLAYWEVLDGGLVRELEGSPSDTINTLDISADGDCFVSGGNDQIVKMWKYQEGVTTHIGVGHAAVVTCARFSSDGNFIVTSDASGGVFVWECPKSPPKEEPAVDIKEKTPVVASPKSPKEEDIKDLPSVRSNKSGGDAEPAVNDDLECPSKSVIICTKNDGEPLKKNSTKSTCSEKSTKSQNICDCEKKSAKSVCSEKSTKSQNIICDCEKKSARSACSEKSTKSQNICDCEKKSARSACSEKSTKSQNICDCEKKSAKSACSEKSTKSQNICDCEKKSAKAICSEKSTKSQNICGNEKISNESINGSIKSPDCGCSVKSCLSVNSRKSKN